MFLTTSANAIFITNGNNSNIIYFIFRDQTAGTVDTGVTVTNIDCYYIEDGALISAKFDVTAHANGDDAFDDEEGFHMGYGVYRIDFPDAAFDGGVGKRVQLIAIDGDGGAFTEIMEVELSAPVNTVAVGGTTQTANDMSGDIDTILIDTAAMDTAGEWDTLNATLDGKLDTIVTAVGNIETDTAAMDTAGEWDTLNATLDGKLDTIVTAVGNIETDTAAQDTAGEWDTLMATVDGKLDTAQADLDTITGGSGVLIDTDAVDADALKTDAITEIWAKALTDIGAGAPSATCSVFTAINRIYMVWRNKVITNGTNDEIEYYNDANTKIMEAPISDDGTDFTKSEVGAVD